MEWVQTTGRTVAEAKEAALDQLGVADLRIDELDHDPHGHDAGLEDAARAALRRALGRKMGKRPLVDVHLIRV